MVWTEKGFQEFVTEILNKNNARHMLDLFIFQAQGGGRDLLEEEHTTRKKGKETEEDKLAKRLMANFENETEFEYGEGVAMELKGDSMAITNWMRGTWTINKYGYRSKVEHIIDTLDSACELHHLLPPAMGCDLWKHFYREGNGRADALTWEKRGQPNISRKQWFNTTIDPNSETLIAIRGAFDGGVSRAGAGGGWWIQGEFAKKRRSERHMLSDGSQRSRLVDLCE